MEHLEKDIRDIDVIYCVGFKVVHTEVFSLSETFTHFLPLSQLIYREKITKRQWTFRTPVRRPSWGGLLEPRGLARRTVNSRSEMRETRPPSAT